MQEGDSGTSGSPPRGSSNGYGEPAPTRLPHAFDLKRLVVLREVARRGSFAAAAEALSFSRSAVSQQMTTLERDVGVLLFERGSRGVRLSDSGVALLAHADAVMARLADAQAELDAIARADVGQLRIGSFTSATSSFVAPAVEIFRERHPGVQVSFFDGEPYENIARLQAREIDLAVIFEFDCWAVSRDYTGVAVCDGQELDCAVLFQDPFLVVLPRDHPLAASATVTLHQLGEEPILGCSPWAEELQSAAKLAGIDLHFDPSCRATGFEAFQAFTARGRGLTLMPRLALGWLRDDLVARPLQGGPVRQVKAAVLAGASLAPPAQAMWDLLCQLSAGGDPADTTHGVHAESASLAAPARG